MLRAALRKQGFHVRSALAGTAAAACALARGRDGAIAEPGQDAAFVAPLPVDALALDPATTHAFRRAGLKTIGQVAARPRAELVARFGEEIATRIDSALGKAGSPISPRQPLPDFMAEHRFADPVTGADIISSTLQTLADRLMHLLRERGQGARAFEAVFFRADGIVRRLVIETGRPLRDAAMVRRLFGEKLDALADPLDPGFGFDLIRLCVPRAEPVTPETVGLDSTTHSEEEINFLIDRLATRFGAGRILRYLPNDTHIPEAAAIATPAQMASPPDAVWEPIRQAGEAPRRPLRLLARPEPVEAVAEIPDGPPLRFRWRQVLHNVVFAEGPERIAMEWWRRQGLTRDYFRVENAHGRRFWLYRDGLYERETDSPKWFVHGIFA
jgi:protein ImuB